VDQAEDTLAPEAEETAATAAEAPAPADDDLAAADALLDGEAGEPLLEDGLEDILAAEDGEAEGPDEPVRFDFNRPHNISKIFEQNLRNMAENLAKLSSLAFTNLFRANTALEFAGLSLRACGDFLSTLPSPTCLCSLALPPLKGQSLIQLDLPLCFTLLKRLMGGATEAEELLREFTEIERNIVQNLMEKLLEMLSEASAKLVELQPEFLGLENNPDFITGMAVGDTLVVLKFDLKLENQEGELHVCLPMNGFEPVRQLFDPEVEVELRTPAEVRRDRQQILELVQSTDSEVVARFAQLQLSLQQIVALKEGSVLPLTQPVHAPLVVEVAGKPLFLGEAGRVNQNRAVKLTRRIPEE
jgi:flagellar motor switch protein FliM